MTTDGAIYLAIILAAFLTFAATLFWSMLTSGSAPHPVAVDERNPTGH
jgi:hypothetical protein